MSVMSVIEYYLILWCLWRLVKYEEHDMTILYMTSSNKTSCLVDMDGVLWRTEDAILGAKESLDFLKAQGKQIFFATNNSLSRSQQVCMPGVLCLSY